MAKNRYEMKVEREIAGFVLPFTAGILITAFFSYSLFIKNPIIFCFPPFALSATMMCLLCRARQGWKDQTTLTFIILTAFFCGVLTGVIQSLTAISTEYKIGLIEKHSLSFGEAIADAIKEIPFEKSETNAIICALLTGNRSDLPPDLIKAFRASGASHILALSGLHLGVIYGFLSKALALIGNTLRAKRIRAICAISICCLYTLSTGSGESITRALLFILIGETARFFGRKVSIKNIFFTALLIQLIISPQSYKSAGFQLSYAAIAGIAFIYPWLKGLWAHESSLNPLAWVWKSASMSISCQISTGPFAWIWFKTLPKYFLLTNLIAVPLAGLIIPSSLITLILHSLGICPKIITRATECLVTTLTDALVIISEM